MPGLKQKETVYPIETIYPEGMEKVPKRYTISWRNKWMVNESDIILCYVRHSSGGAAQFVEYGRQKGKMIINLADDVNKTIQ